MKYLFLILFLFVGSSHANIYDMPGSFNWFKKLNTDFERSIKDINRKKLEKSKMTDLLQRRSTQNVIELKIEYCTYLADTFNYQAKKVFLDSKRCG